MLLRRAIILIPLLVATPAFAGTVDTPGCKRELASITAADAVLAKVTLGATPGAASCAVYRNHFMTAVRARAVVSACKTGPEREQAVTRFDGTVEDINGAIAQSCTGS